jgi:hypothetical protein
MRTLCCLAATILLLGSMPAHAGKDPKLVAKAYVAALKARQWNRIANMMDPREIREVHGFIVPVLKKLVVQRRAWPAPFKQMLEGLTSPAAVSSLTPRQVFIRLLKGTILSIRGGGGALDNAVFTILGQINETPNLVHVVYRAEFVIRGIVFRSLSVITLTEYKSQWRVKLNENMRQVALIFRRLARKL